MTIAERIALATDANDTARMMMAGGIRFRSPDWTEEQVRAEVARRMLGASN